MKLNSTYALFLLCLQEGRAVMARGHTSCSKGNSTSDRGRRIKDVPGRHSKGQEPELVQPPLSGQEPSRTLRVCNASTK